MAQESLEVALIKYNGFYYYLGGKTDNNIYVRNAMEICFDMNIMNYIKKIEKALNINDFNEKTRGGEFVLSQTKNVELYLLIKEKFENKMFSKQVGTLKNIIISGEARFRELSLEKQCFILKEIIDNIATNNTADLCMIGGSSNNGKMRISKKISNIREIVLINQSVTGLYRAEVNLLTV